MYMGTKIREIADFLLEVNQRQWSNIFFVFLNQPRILYTANIPLKIESK